jgi:hypothetical protein
VKGEQHGILRQQEGTEPDVGPFLAEQFPKLVT